jgi:hypothetical protein
MERKVEKASGSGQGHASGGKQPASQWCPRGLSKMQRRRLQKMRQGEIIEKRLEEERDAWFEQARPMTKVKRMWRERRLVREEGDNSGSDSSGELEEKANPGKGGDDSANPHHMETLDVNMVFIIPAKFWVPENEVAELTVDAERAVFEKLENINEHMKILFIKGHMDDKPLGQMMVDGRASINIIPLTTFQKIGHSKGELKQTNMSLTGFSREPAEAKGIISKELMVGSKTMPTAFFVVNVRGRYNILLGHDWVHANG